MQKSPLFSSLPPEWPHSLNDQIRATISVEDGTATSSKLVVLDDDPTGTQTVYDIPVLTRWSVDVLKAELENDLPAFYILTNSRSLPLAAAQKLNAEIGHNLASASAAVGREITVVSRSDSTLRGHYPGEVDALVAAMYGDKTPHATLLIPFFLEGGRHTINDIHYVAEGDTLIPAAETPFAQDAAFGYRNSNLRDWVEEKTNGKVASAGVASVAISDIREGGPQRVAEILRSLTAGQVCVINSASLRDQEVFVVGLLKAEEEAKIEGPDGVRFVYRTAASFVQARLGLPTKPILTKADLGATGTNGGLVVVGSYVPKTTSQLQALLEQPGIEAIEVDVARLLDDTTQTQEIARITDKLNSTLQSGQDAAVYTSRKLVTSDDAEESLLIGNRVSQSLVSIVQGLTVQPRYLIAKGGITSSDVATDGLGVERAMVLGQVLPGVPAWQIGAESRFPGMPYIVFPGNVGDDMAVANVVSALRN